MATFQVTTTKQVDLLIVVEAETEEEARAIAEEHLSVNPDLDDAGETAEGVVSYGTYATDSFTTVTEELA
jgi:hypothetical protein